MSTYRSIDSKAEDAVKAAFIAIGGTDWSDLASSLSFTVNQGGDGDEMVLPCVNIFCSGPNSRAPMYAGKMADHYDLEITVEARSNGTAESRENHSNLFGLLQAVGIQSADQMVAALTAAAIPNFRATQWKHTGGVNFYADQQRVSTLTFSLICHHV